MKKRIFFSVLSLTFNLCFVFIFIISVFFFYFLFSEHIKFSCRLKLFNVILFSFLLKINNGTDTDTNDCISLSLFIFNLFLLLFIVAWCMDWNPSNKWVTCYWHFFTICKQLHVKIYVQRCTLCFFMFITNMTYFFGYNKRMNIKN